MAHHLIRIFLITLVLSMALVCQCFNEEDDHHGHSHGDHGHSHGDHGHSHGGHGHSHGGHGHSHGGHGHSHGGHGHSHGGHGHSHGGHGHSHGGHGHSHDNDAHGHSHAGHSPIDHGKSHDGDSPKAEVNWEKPELLKLQGWQLWFQALSSTLLISLIPYCLLFLIRVENTEKHKPILHLLLSFASGGLLGDAFLHLIPHAIDPHDHTGDHSHTAESADHSHGHSHGHSHARHMQVGLWVVAGILTFLLAEKAMRTAGHGHSHSHDKDEAADYKKTDGDPKTKQDGEAKPKQEVKLAGYLNLAADCMHNFTDGLAIGASFSLGRSVGFVTTATILFHEVPHEIGDYAILLQSGVPVWKARALQLLTAVGALAGTVVALACGGANPVFTSWILPFTAGGFIYIALVTVIPELLRPSSLGQTVKELLGFTMGVGLMVLVGIYE